MVWVLESNPPSLFCSPLLVLCLISPWRFAPVNPHFNRLLSFSYNPWFGFGHTVYGARVAIVTEGSAATWTQATARAQSPSQAPAQAHGLAQAQTE